MLSLTEQRILLDMLLYEFRNYKFSFNNQNIVKSHKFFEVMKRLEDKEKVNIIKKGKHRYYTLTDSGRLDANQRAKEMDTDSKYWFMAKNITWNYGNI